MSEAVPILVAFVAALGSGYGVWMSRRQTAAAAAKTASESEGVIVKTATDVVGLVNQQLVDLRAENEALKGLVNQLEAKVAELSGHIDTLTLELRAQTERLAEYEIMKARVDKEVAMKNRLIGLLVGAGVNIPEDIA